MDISVRPENQQEAADTTANIVRRLEWLALSALKRVPNPPTYFEMYQNTLLYHLMPFEPELEVIPENEVRMKFKKLTPGSGDFICEIKENPEALSQSEKKQSKRRFSSLFQRKTKTPTKQPQISSGKRKEKPTLLQRLKNFLCCIRPEE